MYLLFYKYLILNNRINLPGVGSFFVNYSSAKIDVVNEQIAAPEWSVTFKDEPVIVDRNFLEFVKNELQASENEAVSNIENFSSVVKKEAASGGVELPGIGRLSANNYGGLVLQNQNDTQTISLKSGKNKLINIYDETEYTKPEHRKDSSTADLDATLQERQGEDYWWVWAIVLVIISMAALFYYYI